MQRINTTNKAVDLFGSGKHGFQSGVPASGVKATYISELWCNATQEEQAALIEWAGLTLDAATTIPAQDNKQNLKALALVLQKQLMTSVTTTGTAPTYTAAFTYAPVGNPITVTLTAGLRIRASIHAANNGAASTLNLATLGAKSIKQYDSTGALVDAVLFANQLADLEYNGTVWVVLDPAPMPRGRLVFAVNGTFTAPFAGVYYISMCGGGGGGGGGVGNNGSTTNIPYSYGAGGGGGGAAYEKQAVTLTAGQTVTVTIGAGGGGGVGSVGATYNSGSAGGTTSFGSLLTCAGGGGGSSNVGNGSCGSPGGVGGQAGGTGLPLGGGGAGATSMFIDGHGGIGGDCLLGKGAKSGHSQGLTCGYGGGGAGGRSYYTGGSSGSAGAAGVVIVEW